jgi:hypothetical protein
MPDEPTAEALLEEVENEHLRLRELLAGADEAMLATRPANGKWSILENTRHLVFAEQLHFSKFVPGGPDWVALGLPPHNMREQKRLRMVGTSDAGLATVLQTWQTLHGITRGLVQDDVEPVRTALSRHLRHLQAHIGVIERLLRPMG